MKMKLSEYLGRIEMTQRDFAKLVGVHESTLSRILRFYDQPTVTFIKKVERLTLGKVGLEDWPNHYGEGVEDRWGEDDAKV